MSLANTVTRPARTGLGIVFWAVIAFFYLPIGVLLLLSFNTGTVPRLPLEGLSAGWYRAALGNGTLWQTIALSLQIAAGAAFAAVALGLPAAFALVRGRGALRVAVGLAAITPLVMPALVIGVAQLLFFVWIGLPRSPLAVVIGHATLCLPYATLILLPAVARLDRRADDAAADLGAGALDRLVTAVLPPMLPALASAWLVAFTLSFDEVALASFLVGGDNTFPIYLLAQMRLPQNLPEAMAVAILAAAFSFAIFIAVERLNSARRRA